MPRLQNISIEAEQGPLLRSLVGEKKAIRKGSDEMKRLAQRVEDLEYRLRVIEARNEMMGEEW